MKYWIGFVWLVFMTGCHFLDTESEDIYTQKMALQTPEGIRSMMTGIYDGLQHPDLYGGHLQIVGELMAGSLQKSGRKKVNAEYEEFYRHSISPNNQIVSGIWKQAYKVINQTNQVLQNMGTIPNPHERKQIEGACLYIRGLIHFELGRYFANADSGLAVPYVDQAVTTSDFKPYRDSISTFYTKVSHDFNQAKTLLQPYELPAHQANYWAVEATLARFYFYRNDTENALIHADNVLENSPFTLNQNIQDIFSNKDSEAIFRLKSNHSDNSGAFLNQFYNPQVNGGGFSVSASFKTILDKNLNDTRRFVFHLFEGSKIFIRKFDNKNLANGVNLPIIRLAEMYLIRAESHVLNQADKNVIRADYNQLRVRAHLSADRASSSPIALQRNIDAERIRELAWEGDIYHNKKRRGDSFGALTAGDSKLILPIPTREITLNPNLAQNTGY